MEHLIAFSPDELPRFIFSDTSMLSTTLPQFYSSFFSSLSMLLCLKSDVFLDLLDRYICIV